MTPAEVLARHPELIALVARLLTSGVSPEEIRDRLLVEVVRDSRERARSDLAGLAARESSR